MGKCFTKPTSIIHNLDRQLTRDIKIKIKRKEKENISRNSSCFCQFKIEHEKMICLQRIENASIFKRISKFDNTKRQRKYVSNQLKKIQVKIMQKIGTDLLQ